jgi:hypothetical protein
MESMVKAPEYQRLSDKEKIGEMESATSQVEQAAKEQMLQRILDRRLGPRASGIPMEPPTQRSSSGIPMEAPQ